MNIKLEINIFIAIKKYGPYLLVCVKNKLQMYNSNN
jgi:hypothetical protein